MIETNGLLAHINISAYTGVKTDKNATAEVAKNHTASSRLVRSTKKLFDSPTLKRIQNIAASARLDATKYSLPWDSGCRLVPLNVWEEFKTCMNARQAEFDSAVLEFLNEYDEEKANMKANQTGLGTLYQEEDYPSVDQLKNKFSFAVRVEPIADASRFESMTGIEKYVDELKEEFSNTIQEKVQEGVQFLVNEVKNEVREVVEKLREYSSNKTKFYESWITGMQAKCAMARKLNITKSTELAGICSAIEQAITFAPQIYKLDANIRNGLVSILEKICD